MPAPSTDWSALTRTDIAAIDRWVSEGYPGMVDPDQPTLAAQWQQARQLAEQRSQSVRDYAGWRATVFALVNAARDGHLLLVETTRAETLRWAGLALEYRAPKFLVRVPQIEHAAVERRVPDGAELLGCDGKDSAALLHDSLDVFVADWQLAADRARFASQLFVDWQNPFVSAPRRCYFRVDGQEHELVLNWQTVNAGDVAAAIAPFRRVHKQTDNLSLYFESDGGAWITIGNLADYGAHRQLQQRLQQRRNSVQQAPYVVFDLRGNSGGDSQLGEALVAAIWGEEALVPAPPAPHPKRWRVSPLVLDTVRSVRDANGQSNNPNPNLIRMADQLLPALQMALQTGDTLLPMGQRAPVSAQPPLRQMSNVHSAVFALTDSGCFSSCIIMNYMLQRLGAVHIGDPTGRHTVYGEAWFNRALPSGYATLVLPLAINAYPPGQLGGDAPALSWQGASEDESGLRAWVAATAKQTLANGAKTNAPATPLSIPHSQDIPQ